MRLIDNYPELERRVHILIRASFVCVTLCVLVWAFWPESLSTKQIARSANDHAVQESNLSTQDPSEIRIAGFDATLWYAPKPVAQPARFQPAKVQVRFELLAISSSIGETDEASMTCLVYDPVDDQLRTMRVGDEVHRYRVTAIDQAGMTMIADRNATIRLTLDDGGAG